MDIKGENWLTASHIPGMNVEADEESRKNQIKTEWKLNSDEFHSLFHSLHYVPTLIFLHLVLIHSFYAFVLSSQILVRKS